MRTDTERLDWLEARELPLYIVTAQQRRYLTTHDGGSYLETVFEGWCVDNHAGEYPTPRQAIDAAMDAHLEQIRLHQEQLEL
jgi:hypothetical protein